MPLPPHRACRFDALMPHIGSRHAPMGALRARRFHGAIFATRHCFCRRYGAVIFGKPSARGINGLHPCRAAVDSFSHASSSVPIKTGHDFRDAGTLIERTPLLASHGHQYHTRLFLFSPESRAKLARPVMPPWEYRSIRCTASGSFSAMQIKTLFTYKCRVYHAHKLVKC